MAYKYAAWHGGPDPLEPPFDVRRALDEIGDDVLAGASPSEALRRLLQQGTGDPAGLRGLDELRRKVRQQARQARRRGRLDGTLEQVRELLDRALAAEKRALFPDPDDSARFAEAQLEDLPTDPARAVRELTDYPWRSEEARQAYDEIKDLLRREVLDSQFRGMQDALRGATEQDMAHVREMVAALNDMLAADARGEHTQEQFEQFMERFGEFFPEQPQDLAELVDTLARRAAAQQRPDGQPVRRAAPGAGRPDGRCDGRRRAGHRAGAAAAGAALGPAGPALGRSGADGGRPTDGPGRRHQRAAGGRRPGRAGLDARSGLPGRVPGRHRPGAGRAGARPAGGRRRGGAAPDRAGAAAAGFPDEDRGPAGADRRGRPTDRGDRAAPGVLGAGVRRPGHPRRPRRRRRRGADRLQPRLGVRRRAAAGRRPHGPQRGAPDRSDDRPGAADR